MIIAVTIPVLREVYTCDEVSNIHAMLFYIVSSYMGCEKVCRDEVCALTKMISLVDRVVLQL